ncbi:MAG: hypothetical protein KC417_02410, partial [Myxococcales bacterium]|nr:hypothetical protein [Myxococcales bacterium]
RPFLAFAERLHVPTDTFWTLVGHSVVVLQFVVAAGYLVAPRRDGPSKVAAWLATLAWFAAMGFHIGAEVLDLKIGWFSYYMMIAASALLLPRRPVEWMARHIDRFDAWFRDVANDAATETASVMVQVVLTAAVAVGIASSVDMPGVTAAISLGMASIAVGVFVAARRGRLGVPWRMNAAAFVGALALWAAFSLSETRYDFYRFAGGDARKRGEYERALEAYQKADRYAPEGKSRRAEVEAMKRALGR